MFRIKLFAVSFNSTHDRLFDMGFFEPSVMGGGGSPHHNFVVIAPMIMKFGTGINVFYTKKLMTNSQTSLLIWLKFGVQRCFGSACFKYQVRFYFLKTLKMLLKGNIWNDNLRKSRVLLVMVTPDNLK